MTTVLGGDFRFVPQSINTDTIGPADLSIESGATDVDRDPGLETALIVAIFTNASANDDDELPDDNDERGGHFSEVITGQPFGSRLWLLRRSNLTEDTLQRAKEYTEEAIDRHLVNEGLAKGHEVEVTKAGTNRANFKITLIGLERQKIVYEYYLNWQAQLGRV